MSQNKTREGSLWQSYFLRSLMLQLAWFPDIAYPSFNAYISALSHGFQAFFNITMSRVIFKNMHFCVREKVPGEKLRSLRCFSGCSSMKGNRSSLSWGWLMSPAGLLATYWGSGSPNLTFLSYLSLHQQSTASLDCLAQAWMQHSGRAEVHIKKSLDSHQQLLFENVH